MAASLSAVLRMLRMIREIDVRDVLPGIGAPALIIQRRQDRITPPCHGRYLAAHLPGARYFEQPGDHLLWLGDPDAMFGQIREFLGEAHGRETKRTGDLPGLPPPPQADQEVSGPWLCPPVTRTSAALARTAMADGPRGEQDDGDQEADPQQRPDHVRGRDRDEDDQRDEQDRVAVPAPQLAGRRVRGCRSPCFRQVVEQAVQVGAGLGAHGLADALVELGLVKTAGAEVLGQAVGDRLPLGVGNPHVLV
jgi:hypothetical protein